MVKKKFNVIPMVLHSETVNNHDFFEKRSSGHP